MKFGPIAKITGVVVLGCLSVIAIRYIDSVPSHDLLSFLGFSVARQDVTAKSTSTPTPEPEDLPALALGTVAVQTFSDSVLVRSGSGAVISSDGLIITVAGVAPLGSGSVLRAQPVFRSGGMVLLKVDATDLNPVLFESGEISAGSELQAMGALVSLSSYTPLILRADVVFSARNGDTALAVDRAFLPMSAGARLVDRSGRSVGLVQLTGYARLMPSSVINAVVEEYLAKKK